ncbi:site-specific integrase [Granulosicoccus antarcticus]|uniref:Tyr recombinase domain-containing protein n=1 Tax=Granulosicoccus antarcticus IMCC3135 TaxID=1192854 RepID=A0A2Z2NWM6_9GAMM|nr:site-specific integrase [Granulosicoccus antarcticus]ASJ72127.1 hypothetical protein IMCC3135_10165 [Granulosicoccus antarcticus IMCC3135]
MVKLSTKRQPDSIDVVAGLRKLSNFRRPEWLGTGPDGRQCELVDDVWYLSDHLPGYDKSSMNVSWKRPENTVLRSRRTLYWTDYAKIVAYYSMESDKTRTSRTTSLSRLVRVVLALCFYLQNERRKENISSVKPADVNAYEDSLQVRDISVSHAECCLGVFKNFYLFKAEIGEGLSFCPYVRPGSLRTAAKRVGRANGHTLTLEPDEFFAILESALRVVNNSDDIVNTLDTYLNIRDRCLQVGRKSSLTKISREFRNATGGSSRELFDKVRLAYGAAIVVVFALLGDRKHQVSSLKRTDVNALLGDSCQDLSGTVRKTSPSIVGTPTSTAIDPQVEKALQLILSLTLKTREDYNGDLLLIVLPVQRTANKNPSIELPGTSMYRLLDLVAKNAQIDVTLRPHMFRRAFSMLWTWRFEIGDMYWLSQLLNHSNPIYTRRYTEDEDVWKFFPEQQQKLAYSVMERALTGRDLMVGGVSKSLRRYRRLIQSNVSVVAPELVQGIVEELIERHEYRIVPQADGYCIMSKKRGARARCSTDGLGPNYARRDDIYCVECANFGVRPSNRKHWQVRLDAHVAVFDAATIPILREASKAAIERAETVLGWIDEAVGMEEDHGEEN